MDHDRTGPREDRPTALPPPESPAPPTPATTRSRKPKIRFLTKPEVQITDDGAQVKIVLVNRGAVRVGFRFRVRLGGDWIDIVQPELSLGVGDGPRSITLDVPANAVRSARITVKVASMDGTTLAVGSNGVNLSFEGRRGIHVSAGSKGVGLGWGTLAIGSVAVGFGVHAAWQEFGPKPVVEVVEDTAEPPDTAEPSDTTAPLVASEPPTPAEPVTLTWEVSRPLPSIFPVRAEVTEQYGAAPDLVVEFERGSAVSDEVAAELGAVTAETHTVHLIVGDRRRALGEIVVPTAFDPGAMGPGWVLPTVEVSGLVDVIPAGTPTEGYCFDDLDGDREHDGDDAARPEPVIGAWPTVGAPAAFVVRAQAGPGDGSGSVSVHVVMMTTAPYAALTDTAAEPDPERCRDPEISGLAWGTDDSPTSDEWSRWVTTAVGLLDGSPAEGTADSSEDEAGADGEEDGDDSSDTDRVAVDATEYEPEPATGSLAVGDEGPRVRALEVALADAGHLPDVEVDGRFNAVTEEAVEELQTENELTVDGLAGPATHDALDIPYDSLDSGWDGTYGPEPATGPLEIGDIGNRVEDLQRLLVAAGRLDDEDVDGDFGPTTERAVRAFQQSSLLEIDGIADDETIDRLRAAAG